MDESLRVRRRNAPIAPGSEPPFSCMALRAASCLSCSHCRSTGVRNAAVRGVSASCACKPASAKRCVLPARLSCDHAG